MSDLYHKLQNIREQTRGKKLNMYVYYFKYDFCWKLSFESQMYLDAEKIEIPEAGSRFLTALCQPCKDIPRF